MRKLAVIVAFFIAAAANAQFKVKVNDKPITEATVTKAEDIKTISIAFDKPKKLSYYGLGRLYFWVDLIGEKDEIIESYFINKDGSNAIEAFLADVNVFYDLPSDVKKKAAFAESGRIVAGDGVNDKLKYAGKYYASKTVKFRIHLGFRDKVGYQKYGDLVDLIKPQTYTIDNTTLYTTGQKERAEEKVAEEAKKAEDAKKAEEEKKEADKKEKTKKGKGLLRGVMNKL